VPAACADGTAGHGAYGVDEGHQRPVHAQGDPLSGKLAADVELGAGQAGQPQSLTIRSTSIAVPDRGRQRAGLAGGAAVGHPGEQGAAQPAAMRRVR